MPLPSNVNLCDSKLVSGFPKINQCCWLNAADTAPHNKSRNKNVWRVIFSNWNLYHGLFPREPLNRCLYYALTFNGDKRRGLSKRHPHLKPRILSRLIPLFLRQNVNPFIVGGIKPPLIPSRNPHIPIGNGGISRIVHRSGLKNDIPRNGRFRRTN